MQRRFTQNMATFYGLGSAACWIAAWKMGGEWLAPLIVTALAALVLAVLWHRA